MIESRYKIREPFMPIAVVERHLMNEPVLSTGDICDRLGKLWLEIRQDAENNIFTLKSDSIENINERVARSLNMNSGVFRKKDKWEDFINNIPNMEDDPDHVCSWLFSTLYWDHLTQCRLATTWFFINAIRIQNKLPEYCLALNKLGSFLDDLSGSGPPLYDGQCFIPILYCGSA